MRRRVLTVLAGLTAALSSPGHANRASPLPTTALTVSEPAPAITDALPSQRNGRDIFAAFLDGRADPGCDREASNPHWEQHFAKAPNRLSDADADVLPLFGYVVDAMREADLPTEFALIPFIESGYRPEARSDSGPVGLWQFIGSTARDHKVAVTHQYDGRLSAVDSTRAAVRYLKTLYGMFGGDWRLAVMAYNAGEYRILQAMRRTGLRPGEVGPDALPGLSKTSYAYVEKLHALACVLDHAQHDGELLTNLDHEVPILTARTLPAGSSLQGWADHQDLQVDLVDRLNPALQHRDSNQSRPRAILAPRSDNAATASSLVAAAPASGVDAAPAVASTSAAEQPEQRTHTVRSGESAWSIARRYGITVRGLLSRNGLRHDSVLKPGMVLAFDAVR